MFVMLKCLTESYRGKSQQEYNFMTEYKTFSSYLHSVLDIYENNYGYSPKTIYLDYFWLQEIKYDKDFYDSEYLHFIGFDEEKENQTLAYLGNVKIQIIKDGIDRWLYKTNITDLFDLERFIYIGDIVMTERNCFDTIIRIKKNLIQNIKNN